MAVPFLSPKRRDELLASLGMDLALPSSLNPTSGGMMTTAYGPEVTLGMATDIEPPDKKVNAPPRQGFRTRRMNPGGDL